MTLCTKENSKDKDPMLFCIRNSTTSFSTSHEETPSRKNDNRQNDYFMLSKHL